MLPTPPPIYPTLGPTEGFFVLYTFHSLLNKFLEKKFIISSEGVVQFFISLFEKKILEKNFVKIFKHV